MGPAAGAVIGAGISAIGGILGGNSANRARRKEAQRNRDFQERMSNTEWQRGIADMEAAGINPALAYSQGGASSPGGSMANQEDAISPAISSAMQGAMVKAQVQKLQAEADSAQAISKVEKERSRLLRNPMTIRLPIGGRMVDVTLPGLAAQLKGQIDGSIYTAGNARAQMARNEAMAQILGPSSQVASEIFGPILKMFLQGVKSPRNPLGGR